jgi:hypothetical protein
VIHTYYAVALAPAIAALVAIGGALLWERRAAIGARATAAVAVAVTGGWSFALLERTPSWQPWVRVLVAAATLVAVAGLLAGPRLARLGRRSGLVAIAAVVIAGLGGPAAYAVQTVTTTHSGSIVSAGPAVSGAAGGLGGGFGRGAAARGAVGQGQGLFGPPSGAGAQSAPPQGTVPGSAAGATAGAPRLGAGGFPGGGLQAAGRGGGAGVSTSSALVKALESGASSYRWVAATMGSMNAASYELATGGDPVMAIGGFNNNGGLLSLAQFIRYVRAGDIHYYIASGGGGGGPGGQASSSTDEISNWVASHYGAQTIGGVSVYDLKQ